MKNTLFILLTLVLSSCRGQNDIIQNNLTETESAIINDFLDIELKKEQYKNYKDFQFVVIQEAYKEIKSLNAYEYAYKDWHSHGDKAILEDNQRLGWILDTLEIKKLNYKLANKEQYYWKKSDFKNIKVSLLNYEELRRIINSGNYVSLPPRLNIFLSKPLIIDKNNALISFDIGNGTLGNNPITHFTVLMKKINSKWVITTSYWDGVIH